MRLVIVAALALPAAAPAHTPLQPFAQQVRALESALEHLGEPLSPEDERRINDAVARADEEAAVAESGPVVADCDGNGTLDVVVVHARWTDTWGP